MSDSKGRMFPIILTLIIIMIIIYLFMTIKQPYIECDKVKVDDFDINIIENVITEFTGNKISAMKITKTIVLPDEYANEEELESLKYSLKNAFKYLGSENVSYVVLDDRIIVEIDVDDNETVILNNIEFNNNDGLQMKINSNTKSSDVITLKVGDNYTDGELMTRLKNNGYVCK